MALPKSTPGGVAFLDNRRKKLVSTAILVLLAAAAIYGGAETKEVPPTRLPAPASFFLATDTAYDAAAKSPVLLELHLQRGRLTLGLRTGGRLLTATGSYEWDADQPTLQAGERIVFQSGRPDPGTRTVWQSMDSSQPRYDLLLGSPHLDHELLYTGNSGRAEMNLAGVRLTACDLTINSGHLQARFGESAASCRSFTAMLNSGTLDLSDLGALGAGTYRIAVHSGLATVDFERFKNGMNPDVGLIVDSGTVNLELPPGNGFQVELTVKSGLVYVAGQRYTAGRYGFSLGPAAGWGVLRIEVNSGIVRVK